MQKIKAPTALEQIESKIDEFVCEWEPGSGCKIEFENDELFLKLDDPQEMIGIIRHLELITDFKMSGGVITLEIHEGLLEELYKRRMDEWRKETESQKQEYYEAVL